MQVKFRSPKQRKEAYLRTKRWRSENGERRHAAEKKNYASSLAIRRKKERLRQAAYRKTHPEKVARRSWIITQLCRMARDDGLYEALEKEYENGQRSL